MTTTLLQPPAPSLLGLMRGSPRLAPATTALVATNAAVFIAMLAMGAGFWSATNDLQLAWGANFGPATQDGQWWRLGTALFLHFGFVHLAMNLWALWDCGRLVERLYGTPRFLAVYLGSGLAGNLLSLVVQGDRAVSGGASGAIFGIFGALFVCLLRERRHVDATEFRWLFWGGAAFALASLGLGFVVHGIDNAAHLGGLASGALLGLVLGRPLLPEHPVPRRDRILAATALTGLLALVALNITAPRYRFGEERQARSAIRQFLMDEQRIDRQLQAIAGSDHKGDESFEDVAGRIDADVSKPYQDSFEQLSSIAISPAAPSAANLAVLRQYALRRGDAAHALAEALRANDAAGVRRALAEMRKARDVAKASSGVSGGAAPQGVPPEP